MATLEEPRCNSLGPAIDGDIWACALPEGHEGPHNSGADHEWETKDETGRLRIMPRSSDSWTEDRSDPEPEEE